MSSETILLYAPAHLHVAVTRLKGVGPKQAETLANSKFQIKSVQDLLQHYPRRHLDFTDTRAIHEVRAGDEVTVIGEVKKAQAPPPYVSRKAPLKISLFDGTSYLSLAFFNQPWRAQQLKPGTMIAAKGKISMFRGARQMSSPLVDVIKDAGEALKIVPQYPATADIHTAWLRRLIRNALADFDLLEPLAPVVVQRHRLMDRTAAMAGYHFPSEMKQKFQARRRLVFDELFTLQVGLAYRKRRIERETAGIPHSVHEGESGIAAQFLDALPFALTAAQQKAIHEIETDMARSIPMHRLLQGEVGSGKTVVALYAALVAVQGGYQTAVMAPTEVLANQHLLTITQLLNPLSGARSLSNSNSMKSAAGNGASAQPTLAMGQMGLFGGVETVLLTSSVPAAKRREALARIANGSAQIVVGTHALIQEGVDFSNLGLVVVDEQHRFGVRQRMALKEKVAGAAPDVLIMTATPIPRTLSFTLYGDLDVSVLDELPKGRRPISTKLIEESNRQAAYDLVRSEVIEGRQAYVITALIEESDKSEIKSAEVEAQRLATEVFPDLRVGMMHGRLRPGAKEAVMDQFRRGEIDVLISTTVVEVGVDVPNATVMLVEDAERFGLSQLHQLRGRIGRGAHASTCLLLSRVSEDGEENKVARERLAVMTKTNDGFELANKDLEFRGTGTILGERQSGFSDLRLTQLLKDIDLLKSAREEAFSLIDADPNLTRHPNIRLEMEGRFADRLDWLFRS